MLKEEILKLNIYKYVIYAIYVYIAVIILEKIKMFYNIFPFLLRSIYFMFERS